MMVKSGNGTLSLHFIQNPKMHKYLMNFYMSFYWSVKFKENSNIIFLVLHICTLHVVDIWFDDDDFDNYVNYVNSAQKHHVAIQKM